MYHYYTVVNQKCYTYDADMPVNPETTVRKLVSISRELWEKIEDYRFEQRVKTESEALRRLIEAGLANLKTGKKGR